MDRSLDEIIDQRPRASADTQQQRDGRRAPPPPTGPGGRGAPPPPRDRRREEYPHDGVRKVPNPPPS
ncbi:hypothetical protein LTR91_008441 [Friedmanniomyces endolithicus]|uniref:Uncharacterized protein n=1 Tax=Friedmanniomyces endolithicus TaxID=329885 RepID=A0AAN6QUW8_9PEZI|nr:hypothetical protein LTR94_009708 [Friedmanniomyces endolithicus]KAK0778339.1 hypothetical protein LTR59_013552 [Friedmanniomyces endolithicus]KAK0785392.1 hypothetical protein LTR38_012352 [Friedmanniomyces endolithicus]KAK0786733.1 hypothetical protein LTR75_013090 [Friedmanniomyces endolithicus]KAK0838813.1 hypothetical protein LTR03_011732 [Friedmanniomyces endolithicus]